MAPRYNWSVRNVAGVLEDQEILSDISTFWKEKNQPMNITVSFNARSVITTSGVLVILQSIIECVDSTYN